MMKKKVNGKIIYKKSNAMRKHDRARVIEEEGTREVFSINHLFMIHFIECDF